MPENFWISFDLNLRNGLDYSLSKTLECNQFFRWRALEDGWYTMAHHNSVFRVKQDGQALHVKALDNGDTSQLAECADFLGVLHESYSDDDEFKSIMQSTPFLRAAYESAHGLHLLRQDPWECMLGYIISQNKNVASIKTCMESLCERTGDLLGDDWYRRPTAQEINATYLVGCKLGYREAYIYNLGCAIREGFDLYSLSADKCDKLAAIQRLMSLRGVGPKVASCVALFSLGHRNAWPEDVWIKRAMDEGNITREDVLSYGDHAGLVQEYIYYYITHRSK